MTLRARIARTLAPWWTQNPRQLALEIEGLENAGFRVHREEQAGRLYLRAEDPRDDHRRFLVCHEREFARPPVAFELDPSKPEGRRRFRMIQRYTPGDVVAADLERQEGWVYLAPAFGRIAVLIPDSWRHISGGTHGRLVVGATPAGPGLCAVGLTGVDPSIAADPIAVDLARSFPVAERGLWVRSSEPLASALSDEDAVREVERRMRRAHGRASHGEILGLVAPSDGKQVWLFVRRDGRGPLVYATELVEGAALWQRHPYWDRLRAMRVAVVGTGALGWPVAQLLAEAGVKRFDLFDDDVVASHNTARSPVPLGWTGMRKVFVLGLQLGQANPGIEPRIHVQRISAETDAFDLIECRPDLIVDATASGESEKATNLAALSLGIPVIYAWNSSGPVAARLMRLRPGRGPCYRCVRRARLSPIPTLTTSAWPALEQSYVGDAFDLATTAAAAVRMAVRELLGEAASPDNPDHVVLTFGGPVPVWESIAVRRDPHCEVCGR